MIRRIQTLAALLLVATIVFAQGKAKYVFFFIGDGMGVNQIHAAATYLAAQEGRIGTAPLCMTGFPVTGLANTISATNGVTDSAAGDTALATGEKTKNGVVGMLQDQQTPVHSVAYWAQQSGAAVGVSSSVSVDHATPASFYAHVPDRSMYYQIGQQLIEAKYDFYAGSDFLKPTSSADTTGRGSLYDQCRAAGIVITRGYEDYLRNCRKARHLLLLQSEAASANDRSALPYAINRKSDDMNLSEITRAGIDFLQRKKKNGFFLFVEGGKIDWACHANDAATVIREVLDLDEAVRVAFEFYQKHPKETLIVITADHETGGLGLGRGPYELHSDLLQYQTMSADAYSQHLTELCQDKGTDLTWAMLENDLKTHWGFWDKIQLTEHQSERLKKAAVEVLTQSTSGEVKSMYASVGTLADAARRTLAECALVGWQSGGHSDAAVPVLAIGAGSELFSGFMENTDVPRRIAKAAGWKIK